MSVGAIIPAAGSGSRMGGARKPFLALAGKPLLQYCLDVFFAVPEVEQIVIALPAAELTSPPAWLQHERVLLVAGGAQRADSVRAGLAALPPGIDIVVVHDAARPLLEPAMIRAVVELARTGVSATVALQVTDTLHHVDDDLRIIETPDRAKFWRAQTPQAFPRNVLEQAYARSPDVSAATDEAGLVARAGFPVRVVPGDVRNIKITTPGDVALAEAAFAQRLL
ncbi:MAG TPA: 2-C-methyl-D-erythritol 4-phosphate cytidylyltransferase [Longimicrobiales bacterium]